MASLDATQFTENTPVDPSFFPSSCKTDQLLCGVPVPEWIDWRWARKSKILVDRLEQTLSTLVSMVKTQDEAIFVCVAMQAPQI